MTSRSAESGSGTATAARPPVLVTGAQYELTAGDYRAVVTGLGAGLRELSYAGQPVVYGYPPDELPPGAAGQLLAPWPNRVGHGRYEFEGTSYQLDIYLDDDSTAALVGVPLVGPNNPTEHDANVFGYRFGSIDFLGREKTPEHRVANGAEVRHILEH